jgi:hypothetical protein
MKNQTHCLGQTRPDPFVSRIAPVIALLAMTFLFSVPLVRAQTNVVPELSITPTATNDVVSVVVVNGDSQTSYQILRSYSPDPGTFTETAAIGTIGQTNFSLSMAADLYRFFRATPDLDWDDDGVENWRDAQQYSTNAGLLSVTIELPANGATVY